MSAVCATSTLLVLLKCISALSQVIESTHSILLLQMVATMVYEKVSGNRGQSKHRQQQQMISWITRKLCSGKSGEWCSVITREMWSSEMTTAMSWRKRHLVMMRRECMRVSNSGSLPARRSQYKFT